MIAISVVIGALNIWLHCSLVEISIFCRFPDRFSIYLNCFASFAILLPYSSKQQQLFSDFAIVTLYFISIQRFLNQFCELQSGYFIPVLESSRCSFRLLLFRLRRLAIKNNCPFAAFCWTFPMPAILPVLTRFFANITINGEREVIAHPAIQCVECWTLNKLYVIMTEGGKGRVLNRGFFFQIVKKMPQAHVDQHFIILY
jgi:hypothetical protein